MVPQDAFGSRPLTGLLGLAAVISLAACSDDDDSTNFPLEAFSSTLDTTGLTVTTGADVTVTLRNLAPVNGTLQTPVWIGFHDGQFDTYDSGSAADLFFPTTNALERLAEDGNNDPINTAFTAQGFGSVQSVLAGSFTPGPLAAGESVSATFRLDPAAATSRYFSYASMVLPSNDAFIANGNPLTHQIFNGAGAFFATDFTVTGAEVLDAGTEVNDELPANTAFFGQASPDTGVDENGLVGAHPGFLTAATGTILDDPNFAAADFTQVGYEMLSVSFSVETTPSLGSGLANYTFNPNNNRLSFSVLLNSLSSAASALELLDSADANALELDLTSSITENANGTLRASGDRTLTADQIASLRAGELALSVSTQFNSAGEATGLVDLGSGLSATLEPAQTIPTATAGANLRIAMRNTAPALGTFQTPVWVGVHDGQFDTYDLGSPASTLFPVTDALERLAEDGTLSNINTAFDDSGLGAVQGAVAGVAGPLAPGELAQLDLRVDPNSMAARYFSYASMVLPSNDAFIANGDPLAHPVYDGAGDFIGADFAVTGAEVLDAGTEVNDETSTNTAFFGQATPDTGDDEGANVDTHVGFLAAAPGTILGDPMFVNADFKALDYQSLSVALSEGAPATLGSGQAAVSLNEGQDMLTFDITVAGLSGAATMLHLHNAPTGVAGPVEIDLFPFIIENDGAQLRATGTVPIDANQLASLEAGNLYFNLHTVLNPSGELRGQIREL